MRRFPRRSTSALPSLTAVAIPLLLGLVAAPAGPATGQPDRRPQRPDVVVITVDTLRADRLSGYGYGRPTSPRIDRLLASGARFTEARTVEPLTTPALSSMLTSLYPHEHGATRNGLRVRPGLPSLPKALARRGYATAAFVANWTLKDQISGLAEHFDRYGEVFTRRRWLGLFRSEATAEDVNDEALDWLADQAGGRRPFFLWVHYVEPHAPYLLHEGYAERLGVRTGGGASKSDRYDTEIAFVDQAVGALLDGIGRLPRRAAGTLVVFAADHGESLGEHGAWGHGRDLYEQALRIPFGVVWPGRIAPQTVDAPAQLVDLPATVLGLVELPAAATFHGYDWSPTLTGGAPPQAGRLTYYQAHKAAVIKAQDARKARLKGLLEVAVLRGTLKETLRMHDAERLVFDLAADPGERFDLGADDSRPSAELMAWRERVEHGLATAPDDFTDLDAESAEKLRALGYLD